jgi:uncharacterized protein (DUF305 family)
MKPIVGMAVLWAAVAIAAPCRAQSMPGMQHAGDGSPAAQAYRDATARMHQGMDIPYSGDADRDFVAGMIPHHQGAIDMAKALLAHGDNEALRRIAQEIVITQQQEIVAMRLAVGEPAQPTVSNRTTPHTTGTAPHDTGGMQMSPNSTSPDPMKMK